MGRPGEEVHRGGLLDGVAKRPEPLHVPCQRGGVAGDVYHLFRGHLGDGCHHVPGQTLPGRVHRNDVGTDAVSGQLGGHTRGVAAEKFGVRNAVVGGVGPSVLNGLRDNLGANDPLRPLGQAEGDGPNAAVEVHHGLGSRQGGEVQDHAVKDLGLGGVHLVKGGHRQPEGKAPQGVHQMALSPEGAVGIAQDHVVALFVDPKDHALQVGLGGAESGHQLFRVGEGLAVHQQTAQAFTQAICTDIEVAEEAGAGPFVVGGDMMGVHIVLHRPAETGAGFGLEEALLHIGDGVGALLIEADGVVRNGELDLVSITIGIFCGIYNRNEGVAPSDAGETVGHLPVLQLQLLGVGHVPEGAAAAGSVIGTIRRKAGGGGDQYLRHMAPGAGLAHLVQLDKTRLAPESSRDEAGHAVGKAGNPGAVGGVAADKQGYGFSHKKTPSKRFHHRGDPCNLP